MPREHISDRIMYLLCIYCDIKRSGIPLEHPWHNSSIIVVEISTEVCSIRRKLHWVFKKCYIAPIQKFISTGATTMACNRYIRLTSYESKSVFHPHLYKIFTSISASIIFPCITIFIINFFSGKTSFHLEPFNLDLCDS